MDKLRIIAKRILRCLLDEFIDLLFPEPEDVNKDDAK